MALKLLSLSEVKQSINMTEAIDAMERAFIQLAQQEVTLPLRTGIPVEKKWVNTNDACLFIERKNLRIKSSFCVSYNLRHYSVDGALY